MTVTFTLAVCVTFLGVAAAYPSISQGATFQWQLTQTIDTSVAADVYDIDLFANTATTIASLKSSGKIVICYFSAGSYENWRNDVSSVPNSAIGSTLVGWPDEKWWNVSHAAVRDVVLGRLDMAVHKGCDGVEPDNVDAYDNNNGGIGMTKAHLQEFVLWLANRAHDRDLSIGLKNALDLISCVEPYFDWALNEECHDNSECSAYGPFTSNSKAVFHTEYVDNTADGPTKKAVVCGNVPSGFTTIIKLWDLDAWRLTC